MTITLGTNNPGQSSLQNNIVTRHPIAAGLGAVGVVVAGPAVSGLALAAVVVKGRVVDKSEWWEVIETGAAYALGYTVVNLLVTYLAGKL